MSARRLWPALCAAIVLLCGTGSAHAIEGQIGPAYGITGNGRALHPSGRLTKVGDFPTGGALTPDGRFYWAVDAGHGVDDVQIVDVRSGRVIQVLPLPGAYVGIAFSPDGRTAFVSGEPRGNSHPGAVLAPQGDAIHVFAVDTASGRAREEAPIDLPSASGGTAQSHRSTPIPGFAVPPDAPDQTAPAWPEGLAVTPDGQRLVVVLGQADQVAIVDLATRTSRLVPVGAYPYGVAVARDDRTAFVTNEYDGTVSLIDLDAGVVTGTIAVGGRGAHAEGIVADPHADRAYVAVTARDQVVGIDTARRRVVMRVSVAVPEGTGAAPVAVGLDPAGRTLYAADSGEDAVAAISLAKRPRRRPKPHLVVKVRSPGALAVYARRAAKLRHVRGAKGRTRRAALRAHQLLGRQMHACAGPTRRQEQAYDRAVLAAIAAREHGGSVFAFRRKVAVAIGRLPAIAACPSGFIARLPAGRLIGRIPTAAYPSGVSVTPDGQRLVWLAAKGMGAGPNVDYGTLLATSNRVPPGNYVPDMLLGRVGTLRLPSDKQARKLGKVAAAVLRTVAPAQPPPGTPLVPGGPIKHVFYVVRENRTYDQVLGGDPRGDGDPRLVLFGDNNVPTPAGGVTPNAHALSRRFPLLDHVYADSEVSVDGHMITSGGYAIDYVQKTLHPVYSARGRVNEFGDYPVTFPPNAFLFDQAVRQGVSFRNYGEHAAGIDATGDDGRPTYSAVRSGTDFGYPARFGCSGANPDGTNNAQVCDTDSGTLGPQGNPTRSRLDYFERDFESELALGTVPALSYITLPNDHTNGVKANYPTPRAMVADNDLGLGQLVDLISHSPIWSQSVIFVVEDDSQDGPDHVDAHRMPAFVISPWARSGAVVHTRYDQESALRSIELILGLRPLSLFDGGAAPMYDAFVSGGAPPDFSSYAAVQPQVPLNETTPAPPPGSAGRLARALPFEDTDLVPQELSDRVLWRSVYGPRSRPPRPGPNASVDERARAVGALRALRGGRSVRRFLRATAAPDG